MSVHIFNAPAHGIPYFAAAQVPAAGTADEVQSENKPLPKLFQPIKIRGVEFHNRIFVSLSVPLRFSQVVYDPLLVVTALPIFRREWACYAMASGSSYVSHR